MPFEIREEVLNVVLAELLERRGLLSVPETVRRSVTSGGRRLPDVTIADLWGIRVVLEGRISSNPAIREGLLSDARARVTEGVSPICLAVLYPAALREVDSIPQLRRSLSAAPLLVRVVSEGEDGEWAETNVNGLAEILRHSYELLVSEDVVSNAVEELQTRIDAAAEIIAASPASPTRLRQLLGIPEQTGDRRREEGE